MFSLRQRQGRAGERLARAYLEHAGYRILACNVGFRVGELDLVAQDGGTLCFIEVRMRAVGGLVTPLQSITDRKRRRFLRAARWYLARQRARWEGPVRCDVVAIEEAPRRPPSVVLIKAAFYADPLPGRSAAW